MHEIYYIANLDYRVVYTKVELLLTSYLSLSLFFESLSMCLRESICLREVSSCYSPVRLHHLPIIYHLRHLNCLP